MSGGSGYRRLDLQTMAEAKLFDAVLLAEHERYSNAYYLAGYAIELAIKSCIAKQFNAETIPDLKLVQKLYSHTLADLIGVSGLAAALRAERASDRIFAANWSTVSEWNTASRYEAVDKYTCGLLIGAIRDANNGVLRWLKRHW